MTAARLRDDAAVAQNTCSSRNPIEIVAKRDAGSDDVTAVRLEVGQLNQLWRIVEVIEPRVDDFDADQDVADDARPFEACRRGLSGINIRAEAQRDLGLDAEHVEF